MNYQSLWKHLFLTLILVNFSITVSSMDDILHRLNDPIDDMSGIETQIEEFL